jgi:hypothetical protein
MSLGWLSIGANGEVALTDLNVDNGTLKVKVDNVNNVRRVGINVGSEPELLPGEIPKDKVLSIAQIGATDTLPRPIHLDDLSDTGLTVFNQISVIPSNTEGTVKKTANIIVSSTDQHGLNKGGSIGIGGVMNVPDSQMMFTRLSGLRTGEETIGGDFALETLAPALTGSGERMFERLRVTSSGNVGIGISNPVNKLVVDGIIHVGTEDNTVQPLNAGIVNRGKRVDVPNSTIPSSNTTTSADRINTTVASTIINPKPGTRGYAIRIDSERHIETVHGLAAASASDLVFAAGEFQGDIPTVVNDDGQEAPPTGNLPPDGFRIGNRRDTSAGFISQINALNDSVQFFTFFECINTSNTSEAQADVIATSVTVGPGTGSGRRIYVTGFIEGKRTGSTTFRIYNRSATTVRRNITIGVRNGRRLGFVMVFDFNIVFQNVVFQVGDTQTIENTTNNYQITPVSCKTYTQENVQYLLVAGKFTMLADLSSNRRLRILNDNYEGTGSITASESTITYTRLSSGAVSDNDEDIYIVRYVINGNILSPNRLNAVVGSGFENVIYGASIIDVDESAGEIYLCGNTEKKGSENPSVTLFTDVGTNTNSWSLNTHTNIGNSLLGTATSIGFVIKFISSPASMDFGWITKLQSSEDGSITRIRSLVVNEELEPDFSRKTFVYLIGSTSTTIVNNSKTPLSDLIFFNKNTVNTYTQAMIMNKTTTSADGYLFLAKYNRNGEYQWSTSTSSSTKSVEGAFIRIDDKNTIYTGFEYIDDNFDENNNNVITVDVYQRSGRLPGATSFTPNIKNNIVRGKLSFVALVAYNPDGKVLFTSKIDGLGGERITAMDVFRGDQEKHDIVLGITSFSEQFNCFDMSGISYKFVTGLPQDDPTKPAAFVVGLPTFHFYLIDPADNGAVHKITNVSQQRGFIIPYYEREDIERTFTDGIISIPERSVVELTFISGGDEDGTWFASKDPDAGLIVVDKQNGGVGIGTTDPLELFHVEGSAFFKGNLIVDGRIVNPLINFGAEGEIGIGTMPTTGPAGFIHINKASFGSGTLFKPSILLTGPGTSGMFGTLDFRNTANEGFRFRHEIDGRLTVNLLRSGADLIGPPIISFSHRVNSNQSISDSNAQVGFGTEFPEAKFHVEGSSLFTVPVENNIRKQFIVSKGAGITTGEFENYSSGFQVATATDREFNSVKWFSGTANRYVAVSNSDRIDTSSDGKTWTQSTDTNNVNPIPSKNWTDVAYAPSLNRYVAVASDTSNNVNIVSSTNGTSWTTQSNAIFLGTWKTIAWSPERSRFVVLQNGSTFLTSTNGTSWTASIAFDGDWQSVIWAPEANNGSGLFVAVASFKTEGSTSMYSSDGLIWTTSNAAARNWRSVAWSPTLGRFVAVGSSSTIRVTYSNNGTSWLDPPAGTGDGTDWRSVTWSDKYNIFVAVGSSGTNRMMTSPDGITWTSYNIGELALQSIAWSPIVGNFVMVANADSGRIRYSPDDFAATVANVEGNLVVKDNVIVNGDIQLNGDIRSSLFTGMVSYFATQTPPQGWLVCNGASVSRSTYSDLFNVIGTTYGNGFSTNTFRVPDLRGLFIRGWNDAIDETLPPITVGNDWVTVSIGSTQTWTDVIYVKEAKRLFNNSLTSNGFFLAVGYTIFSSVGRIAISLDGSSWSRSTLPNGYWRSVAYDPSGGDGEFGRFVAVSSLNDGGKSIYSDNGGISWATATLASREWRSIARSTSRFVAVASTGSTGSGSSLRYNRIARSTNGITWELIGLERDTAPVFTSVIWVPSPVSRFVAVGEAGLIETSTSTGQTWTRRSSPNASLSLQSVAWSPQLNLMVAVSSTVSGNQVITSPDGITWNQRTTPSGTYGWRSVTWSPEVGLFVAVATDGIMTSPNGIDWLLKTSPVNQDWSSITWSSEVGRFVAVGFNTNLVLTNDLYKSRDSSLDLDRQFGSNQGDTMRRITGTTSWSQPDYNHRNAPGGSSGVFIHQTRTGRTDSGANSDTCTRNFFDNAHVTQTSHENRPLNISLLPCIKY